MLLIEHHLDVIKTADHVIDLGPEGGHAGGEVVVDRHAGGGRGVQGVAHRTLPQASSAGSETFVEGAGEEAAGIDLALGLEEPGDSG